MDFIRRNRYLWEKSYDQNAGACPDCGADMDTYERMYAPETYFEPAEYVYMYHCPECDYSEEA